MDLKEIQNLIKFVANSGVAEVKLETGDVKITIRTTLEGSTETTYVQQMPTQNMLQQAVAPQQIAPVAVAPVAPVVADDNAKYITVKSPIIGTFYRKPSPDKPMFVEVGSTIGKGDVLCGKIVKVLVDDMSPVEFDQPLFLVDPS
jgi:acetyl-CoA carboxylase biotin carboxyl carrier protein